MAAPCQVKQNSTIAVTMRGMMMGYTMKDRFIELYQTFQTKRANYEHRHANDQEFVRVQEQVIIYLKSSNYELKMRLGKGGDADRMMMDAVLRPNPRLMLELQRGTTNVIMGKVCDKVQDRTKTFELLRHLRKKRLQQIRKCYTDLEFLQRIGRDRDDIKLEQEIAVIQSNIAKKENLFATAKLAHDKMSVVAYQLREDQSMFTARMEAMKGALYGNLNGLQDIRLTYGEAKRSRKKCVKELEKVTKITAKKRSVREEKMSSQLRLQQANRFEALKARQSRATRETGQTKIITPATIQIGTEIEAAKIDIIRYAETFLSMSRQTSVDVKEMITRLVSQGDIFDELRRRKTEIQARQTRLMMQLDALKAEHFNLKFSADQKMRDSLHIRNQLLKEIAHLRVTRDACEEELQANGNHKQAVGTSVDILHNKLKALPDQPASSDPGHKCADCEKLLTCAEKLARLIDKLKGEPAYREALMKMCCSLFQEPLEDCTNLPSPQPYTLPRVPSAEGHLGAAGHQVLSREEHKKRSEKMMKLKKAPVA